MVNKRIAMHYIQEIRRLKELGHTKKKISKILGMDRGTIMRYWNLKESVPNSPSWVNNIDWSYVKGEAKKGVPRKILYEEQKELADLPSYQAFCQYLRNHGESKQPEVVIRQQRNPGESIEVDYSGDGREIVFPSTGEICNTELFVGTLSYSGHIYAEFTLSQKLEDFIMAHVHMFTWFGGVSKYIIPDNCKTAVTKTHKYDPLINPTYLDMCKHYEITVDPADPVSPRHKPNVEKAVGYIQSDFLARTRNKTYSSMMELNRDLKHWLRERNDRPIQGRGQSRNHFLEKERPMLSSLPGSPYEIYYFKKAKIHPDCHFQHNKNYYSVPHRFVGKEVDLKFNSKMVHAYVDCERVVSHPIMAGAYHYSTNTEHFPEKKYVDTNYHLEQARKRSISAGINVSIFIERLIKESKYPLKILRKVQGIMALQRKFSKEALDYGCEQALLYNRLNYDHVKRFANNYKKDKDQASRDTPVRQLKFSFLQGDNNDTNE